MKGCRTPGRMMKALVLFIVALFFIFACNNRQEPAHPVSFDPRVVKAHGKEVHKDSITEPQIFLVDEKKLKKVPSGKPKVVPANTNVHPAGIPRVLVAGIPKICTPGQDSFSLPVTVDALSRPFAAGIPEIVVVKEAYSQDHNSQNFSSIGKLQGLKSNGIFCLEQDRYGNLWFGTQGGGVCKYDGTRITHFTETEGLKDKFVRSILSDKNGDLWFGTWDAGVCKYDGKTFTHFTKSEGLLENNVGCMEEDKKGNIWFGTSGGVSRYDGKTFTHYTEKEGLLGKNVESILVDKLGNLWIGTSEGVSNYDGNSFRHFAEKEGLLGKIVECILEDQSGNLWFGTSKGASKYNGKTFTHYTEKEGLNSNAILDIHEDKSGNLWFATLNKGVSQYDGKTFTQYTEVEGLISDRVWDILEDQSGNLWFGTARGVSKFDDKRFTHYANQNGLNINYTCAILKDQGGNLWFGTVGSGVIKFDGKEFTHYTVKEGLSHNAVWSILEDSGGNLWFGTFLGLSKYDGKSFTYYTEEEGLVNNDVKCILEDKSGNLWFGTVAGVSQYDGKRFINYTVKQGLSNNSVMDILEDKMGHLWFCGYTGGVSKYDGNTFTHYTEKEGLNQNDVRCMLQDKNGKLWFGTLGGGVSKYDGNTFTRYTEKEGLTDNYVISMLEDKKGNLWFGTRFGINKLPLDHLSNYPWMTDASSDSAFELAKSDDFFKTYTYEEGFTGIGVNMGRTMCEGKDGTIWIGADDQLTALRPGEESLDTLPPNIQLTGLSLFNENIPWQNLTDGSGGAVSTVRSLNGSMREKARDTSIILGNGVQVHDLYFDGISRWYGLPEHLNLAYNNNFLTFQFVGITTESPKKVKYQYKLEGLDPNWSALTSRSEATYGNLAHGQYTFKVKAMNGSGYWSNELNYSFAIRAPWWLTWWFRILGSMGLLSSITLIMYLWFQYKFRQKLKVELLRQKIASDLHDEIGSNLSSMAFSAELVKKKLNGSRGDIEPILNKLVNTFQETSALISDTIWSLNPRNDTFDKLKERMENFTHDILSSKEMEYQFHANGHGPAPALSLDQKRNIYLIYKEAINNIAKHSKASLVNIRLESFPDKLVIEIMDNGIGFDTAKTNEGNGLNNFKSRSVKDSCVVQYFSAVGKGTVVKITANYYPLKSVQHLEHEKQKST